MKAEIVTMAPAGHHNETPESSVRILEGGSWKKQRVIVLMPASNAISSKVVLTWLHLIYPPNQAVHRMLLLGMEVGDAYTQAIEQILGHPELSQWEYILTLEHDNAPPGDGLVKLLNQLEIHPEYACIGGLYWTKGEGGVPQIWGDPQDTVLNFRPQPPRVGELVECCGTGMGFNVWRLSMFKDNRLRKPWFRTLTGAEGLGVGTQDLYFWGDVRQYGYRCAVDCGVLVGHYDKDNDKMW